MIVKIHSNSQLLGEGVWLGFTEILAITARGMSCFWISLLLAVTVFAWDSSFMSRSDLSRHNSFPSNARQLSFLDPGLIGTNNASDSQVYFDIQCLCQIRLIFAIVGMEDGLNSDRRQLQDLQMSIGQATSDSAAILGPLDQSK
jgi:hypothetical protein